MRKLSAVTALCVTALFGLTACTDSSEQGTGPVPGGSGSPSSIPSPFDTSTISKDEDLAALLPADIRESGTLVVGTNPQYAPAEFLATDGKTPIGYDMEIIRALGALLGIDVKIQSGEFASIIPGLGTKYDIGISSITISPERIAQVNMISYFNAGEAFAVAKGNPLGLNPSDLCGRTIAVQTGTVEDEGADELSAACVADGKKALEILRFASQADATTNLVGGKADVMYADAPVVGFAINQTGGQIEQLGDQFNTAPQGVVVPQADADLTTALQKALQTLMDNGTLSAILARWGVADLGLSTAELNPSVQ